MDSSPCLSCRRGPVDVASGVVSGFVAHEQYRNITISDLEVWYGELGFLGFSFVTYIKEVPVPLSWRGTPTGDANRVNLTG